MSKHRPSRRKRRVARATARAAVLLVLVVVAGTVLTAGRLGREQSFPLLGFGVAGAAPSPTPSPSLASDKGPPRWPAFARAGGVTIYLPAPSDHISDYYKHLQFANAHGWDEFLRNYNAAARRR